MKAAAAYKVVGHARRTYQQDQNNWLDHIADRAFLWVSIAGKGDEHEEQAQGRKVVKMYEVSEAMNPMVGATWFGAAVPLFGLRGPPRLSMHSIAERDSPPCMFFELFTQLFVIPLPLLEYI